MAVAKKYETDSAAEIEAYFERLSLRQAPAWRPEPNTTIKAVVIDRQMGGIPQDQGGFGRYPIVTYRVMISPDSKTEIGTNVAVHCFHTTLRERLAELKTDNGSVQWLTYVGERISNTRKDSAGNPQKYYLYDVENDGQVAGKADEEFTF